jgi:hypothetical protein
MELNNKLREVFFSLYRGQLLGLGVGDGLSILKQRYPAQSAFTEKLVLKPLSSLSDEDSLLLPSSYNRTREELLNYHCRASHEEALKYLLNDLKPHDYDFLRFKGYALPWMGVSVERMVDAGWVVLEK